MPEQQRAQLIIAEPGAAQHKTIHPLFFQRLQYSLLALRVLIGVAQKDIVPVGVGHVLRAARHIGEKRVGNIRYHQTERARSPGSQPASNAAGPVAQLFNNFQNAAPGGGADITFIIDHPRDSHQRDVSLAGDIGHGHTLGH